jgi:type I restriction enzyme S subunit
LALAVSKPAAEAPHGWEWLPLSELARLESGHTPSRRHPEYWGGDVPWISITDAKRCHGRVIHDTAESTNALGIANSSARLIPTGAVCLSRTASVGYVVITGRPMATSQDFVNWVCGDRLVPEFLQYLLLAEGDSLLRFSSGAVHKTIYFPEVKAFHICVPSVAEQRRLVAILDEAFEAIATAKANTEKNLQNARGLFESHMRAALVGHGEGRIEVALGDVCGITSRLVDPREERYIDLPHVGAANIESRSGLLANLLTAREELLISGKFLFDPTMVLYSKIRPYLMKVVRPEFSGLCSADIYPLSPKQGQIDRDYLFYLLLSPSFTDYAIRGSSRAGMPKVNREHLFAFRCAVPSVEEQKVAAARLDALARQTHGLRNIYEQKLAALDELKKSLLHQAFTGQLTAKSTDRQLAEAA